MDPKTTTVEEGEKASRVTVDAFPYRADANRFTPCSDTVEFNDLAESTAALRAEPETSGETSVAPSAIFRDPAFCYTMTGNKILVIFNHYKYEKWRQPNFNKPANRDGTEKDVEKLEQTFDDLGFDVVTHHDLTYLEIKERISDLCTMDHSATSCLSVAVLTHGYDNYLCAADTLFPVSDVTVPLISAHSLRGKPKLFFLQACREGHVHVDHQSQQQNNFNIPMGSDYLVLYASYEDYVSIRNPGTGTWLIQILCEVIKRDGPYEGLDLKTMIRHINKRVSEKASIFGKQMPITECNMKKILYL